MSDLNTQHNNIVWFDVGVSDLNRAVDFYRAVLNRAVTIEKLEDFSFAVFEHEQGNGGCLVPTDEPITSASLLVYFNVNGRIKDAVAQVTSNGGKIIQDVHPIGPHGFRAIIEDSEKNKVALHSTVNE